MHQLVESLTDPADHLALDEAALLSADAGELPETIRVWEFEHPVVVVGRSSKVDFEVDRAYCQANSIRIMRRCSGGASIVGGPGCLMYSVVINLATKPELRRIDQAHVYVMNRVLAAIQHQVSAATLQGTCDLTIDGCKFSGNSLRIARQHLLYHGTILYQANLDLLSDCLRNAPRQPKYRAGRGHRQFVKNIQVDPSG